MSDDLEFERDDYLQDDVESGDDADLELAQEELREQAKQDAHALLGEGAQELLDPSAMRERIEGCLEVLADFKNRREPGKSRAEYMEQLARDLSEYYGYLRELTDMFLSMFPPNECVEFMEASDRHRPLVIRANTLKTRRKDLIDALQKRGVSLEALPWSKVAVKISESQVPVGATPEYLAGHYMLQAASSLCPVMALDPRPGERVLDMSSAPGGKTSYIAQLMRNTGTVIANDLKPNRQKATVANLHRLGIRTAVVCCHDGRKFPKVMGGFDRVLLDAPCSGLGIISRDQSVKLQRTIKDVQRNAHLQKELLLAAIDCTDAKSKTGGIIVYSTCSVAVEENEQVVQYALSKRYVRIVETGLTLGKPGYTRYMERRFHPKMAETRRFYPHVHNMDGFYVAKLQKYQNGVRKIDDESDEGEDDYVEDEETFEEGSDDQEIVDEDEDDGEGSADDAEEEEDEQEEEEVEESESEEEPETPMEVSAAKRKQTPKQTPKQTSRAAMEKRAPATPAPAAAKKAQAAAAAAAAAIDEQQFKTPKTSMKRAKQSAADEEDDEDFDESEFKTPSSDITFEGEPRRGKRLSIRQIRALSAQKRKLEPEAKETPVAKSTTKRNKKSQR